MEVDEKWMLSWERKTIKSGILQIRDRRLKSKRLKDKRQSGGAFLHRVRISLNIQAEWWSGVGGEECCAQSSFQ